MPAHSVKVIKHEHTVIKSDEEQENFNFKNRASEIDEFPPMPKRVEQ